MNLCCYGCGNPGIYALSTRTIKTRGKFSCSAHYRQCPIKRREWAVKKSTMPLSEETKRKIGEKSKGRPSPRKGKTHLDDPSIIAGENHPHFGKKFSKEHRAKISNSRSGIPLSSERKHQISAQMSGKGNPRYGKSWNEGQYDKWLKTINERGTVRGSNNPNYNPNLDREAIRAYRDAVYRLSKRNWRSSFGPYKAGRIEGGFELDHIVPVSVCFSQKIPVEIAASLQNLQLIPWSENAVKRAKYDPVHLKMLLEKAKTDHT